MQMIRAECAVVCAIDYHNASDKRCATVMPVECDLIEWNTRVSEMCQLDLAQFSLSFAFYIKRAAQLRCA